MDKEFQKYKTISLKLAQHLVDKIDFIRLQDPLRPLNRTQWINDAVYEAVNNFFKRRIK